MSTPNVTLQQLQRETTEFLRSKNDFLKRAEEAQEQLKKQKETHRRQRLEQRMKRLQFQKQKYEDADIELKNRKVRFVTIHFCSKFTNISHPQELA